MVTIEDAQKKETVKDKPVKTKYSSYVKAGEYILLVIVLFVLAIIFWHLMAFLVQAIKRLNQVGKP